MSSSPELYQPRSEFLLAVLADEVSFSDDENGRSNLVRLMELTMDDDTSNRDWATMLLASEEIDTAEVRLALTRAAEDDDPYVRAEAISGLARRDPFLALPLVRRELEEEYVAVVIFEAAERLADASLISLLERFDEPSDCEFIDRAALRALAACRGEAG